MCVKKGYVISHSSEILYSTRHGCNPQKRSKIVAMAESKNKNVEAKVEVMMSVNTMLNLCRSCDSAVDPQPPLY
jgi:hypothetical protein